MTEKQHFILRHFCQLFQFFKVNFPTFPVIDQFVLHNFSSIIYNCFSKRIIDRWLNDNSISRLCESFRHNTQCRNNSICKFNPFRFCIPAISFLLPCCNQFCCIVSNFAITINRMRSSLLNGIHYRLRAWKIHVRNPKR